MSAEVERYAFADRLQEEGLATPESLRGCSASELEVLENSSGLALPARYKQFLSQVGHAAGRFLRGTDFTYRRLALHQQAAREIFEDVGSVLPEGAFVFAMHQGYEILYFLAFDGDDPRVFHSREGDEPQEVYGSFTEWFEATVADEASEGE